MLSILSEVLTAVIGWVTSFFDVITENQFLMVFVILGVSSMLVGLTLTMIRGLRK